MNRRDALKATAGLAATVATGKTLAGDLAKDIEIVEQAAVELLPLHLKATDKLSDGRWTSDVCDSIKLNGIELDEVCPEASEVNNYVDVYFDGQSQDSYLRYGKVEIGGFTAADREDHRRMYPERYAKFVIRDAGFSWSE